MNRRFLLLLVLGGCEDRPIPTEEVTLPALSGEVVVIDDAPIAGGAATVKFEIAPLDPRLDGAEPVEGADYHFEAQVRYAAPVLGGRAAGDYVPYLALDLDLVNVDTGGEFEFEMAPVVGIHEGWHYFVNVDLDGAVGLSEAGYNVEVVVKPIAGVVIHSDLLDSKAGTFFGPDDTDVYGFFTLEDLAAPAEEDAAEEESEKPAKPKMPGGGYGY